MAGGERARAALAPEEAEGLTLQLSQANASYLYVYRNLDKRRDCYTYEAVIQASRGRPKAIYLEHCGEGGGRGGTVSA